MQSPSSEHVGCFWQGRQESRIVQPDNNSKPPDWLFSALSSYLTLTNMLVLQFVQYVCIIQYVYTGPLSGKNVLVQELFWAPPFQH